MEGGHGHGNGSLSESASSDSINSQDNQYSTPAMMSTTASSTGSSSATNVIVNPVVEHKPPTGPNHHHHQGHSHGHGHHAPVQVHGLPPSGANGAAGAGGGIGPGSGSACAPSTRNPPLAVCKLNSPSGTPPGSACAAADDKRLTFSDGTSDEQSRRTRSLNAPSPIQQFGPCGRIMKNSAMVMQIQDPAFQRLTWYKTPLTVLVIKKTRDISVLNPFVQLTRFLIEEKRMVVHVESAILDDAALNKNTQFLSIREKLQVFREGRDDLTDKIDFIICLGGDGTLLYASSLFQQSVPPVMAFHLGSLGFLTPFLFDNFQDQVTNVLEGNAALTLRSRLKCTLKRRHAVEDIHTPANNGGSHQQPPGGILNGTNHKPTETERNNSLNRTPLNFLVLNEVVVDRGPSPYLSNVDLFIDGKHVTVVQGDGLIVSTPTGSTAYAVAAGASMIHPSVPAIMITPICPHSLSFRPIVVPAGVELKIKISPDSRNTAWVSFDGRNRQELQHGDALSVTTSVFPVPSICAQDQIQDWFDSLADCLQWNVRKRQRTFDESDDVSSSDSYEIMEN